MADLVTSLASQTGIDPEKVRKGLGALLAFLEEHLGGEVAGKVQAAIPGSKEMVSEFESGKEDSGGGLFGAVAGLAGKLVGGQAGTGAGLLSALSQAGLGADQVRAFLPKVLEHLQGHLPPDLLERIRAVVPDPASTPSTGGV